MANLQDIKNLEKERDQEINAIRQEQENRREQRIDAFVRSRILSLNAPQPTPYGQKPHPVLTKDQIDKIRREAELKCRLDDDRYLQQVREKHDARIRAAQIEAQNQVKEHNQQELNISGTQGHEHTRNENTHSIRREFKDSRHEITENSSMDEHERELELQHDEPVLE